MKPWNDPKWVSKTPLATVILLEYANLGQLWRMWTTHTAAGQSVWSWLAVQVALWLWFNFYRVLTPAEKIAIRCTVIGIVLNAAVVVTVAYFRWHSV